MAIDRACQYGMRVGANYSEVQIARTDLPGCLFAKKHPHHGKRRQFLGRTALCRCHPLHNDAIQFQEGPQATFWSRRGSSRKGSRTAPQARHFSPTRHHQAHAPAEENGPRILNKTRRYYYHGRKVFDTLFTSIDTSCSPRCSVVWAFIYYCSRARWGH